MPIDPATLPVRWPKTTAALARLGCVLDTGPLPETIPASVGWAAVTLRAPRNNLLSERRQAVRTIAESGGEATVALLTEALLRDSKFEIRELALTRLAALPGSPVDGVVALGLVDSRSKVVRQTASRLLATRGPAAFSVIVALWEDRAADRLPLAFELAACAERTPRVEMRLALNTLEKEARRLFQPSWRRSGFQNCRRRIDSATAGLKDLPLTASVAATDIDLPLPALAPASAVDLRPLPWWRRILRRASPRA